MKQEEIFWVTGELNPLAELSSCRGLCCSSYRGNAVPVLHSKSLRTGSESSWCSALMGPDSSPEVVQFPGYVFPSFTFLIVYGKYWMMNLVCTFTFKLWLLCFPSTVLASTQVWDRVGSFSGIAFSHNLGP